MAICGLGIDVCGIDRVKRSLERYGDRFAFKVLGEAERAPWKKKGDPASTLAGRFAVKEAAFKALGAPEGILFRDVEVAQASTGAISLVFHGVAKRRAEQLGVQSALASISHDAGVAAAVVVLEQ